MKHPGLSVCWFPTEADLEDAQANSVELGVSTSEPTTCDALL